MLTVEEVKRIAFDDWIWIEYDGKKEYTQKWFEDEKETDERLCANAVSGLYIFYYKDYGKTWIAYKNKEQAEMENKNAD